MELSFLSLTCQEVFLGCRWLAFPFQAHAAKTEFSPKQREVLVYRSFVILSNFLISVVVSVNCGCSVLHCFSYLFGLWFNLTYLRSENTFCVISTLTDFKSDCSGASARSVLVRALSVGLKRRKLLAAEVIFITWVELMHRVSRLLYPYRFFLPRSVGSQEDC